MKGLLRGVTSRLAASSRFFDSSAAACFSTSFCCRSWCDVTCVCHSAFNKIASLCCFCSQTSAQG